MIVGVSIALAGYSIRFLRTGGASYRKVIRVILPILLILVVLQPTVFGDMMGKAVTAYDPTKFALFEGANVSFRNPLIAFLAYGDPSHVVVGFDSFFSAIRSLGNLTIGHWPLASCQASPRGRRRTSPWHPSTLPISPAPKRTWAL